MEKILAKRLKSARIMKGISMDTLCSQIDNIVTKQSIHKYETGKMMPDSTTLIALSNALGVSVDYFFRPYSFEFIEVEFKKDVKMGLKSIHSVRERARDIIERYFQIEDILNIELIFNKSYNKTTVSANDVKEVANKLRKEWNLGENGITNTISILEKNNIRVIELETTKDFNGLSGYINNDNPFIILNKNLTAESLRLTAMHELGHIILNFSNGISDDEQERLCNIFATEMLIPSTIFTKIIGEKRKDISLQELIPIQKEFGISIDDLMYKAKELNIITDLKYKNFCNKKRSEESFKDIIEESRYPSESSTRFTTLIYKALSADIITYSKAAALLETNVNDIKESLNLV